MANVESIITPYRIKQSVLEAWLKYKFPDQDITVTVKDADYVVMAPESISQADVRHLKNLETFTG